MAARKVKAVEAKSPRNIGNSLLPSSNAQVLSPIAFSGGTLRVVPDENYNTHFLVFESDGYRKLLAQHPNGFSCRALADRMVAGRRYRGSARADRLHREVRWHGE